VDKIREELFEKWPTAQAMKDADEKELAECIRSLGMQNKRTNTLKRFSKEWLEKWEDPSSLYGIGKYAKDSWKIFYQDAIDIEPSDHVLKDYLEWKKSNMKRISPTFRFCRACIAEKNGVHSPRRIPHTCGKL
jgi:hypothetical protein